MKRKNLILLLCAVALNASAQGTLADYQRAYSLYGKFKSDNVYHWAHNLQWNNSTDVFHYEISTPEGRRYIVYNAATGDKQTYNSNRDMLKALNQTDRVDAPSRKDSPFRHHERHWMETDDEDSPNLVTSPDGKMDAWIEGYNVVVHKVGTPYSEKHVLTMDGTIGRYYSNQLLWSPDSKYIFTCMRNKVQKRYDYYVESSPADQLQPILHKQEYAKPGDELPQHWPVIINVETGKKVSAPEPQVVNQFSLDYFQWTPDSKTVTMEYNQRGHKLYEVLAMNVQDGSLKPIVTEQSNTFVNYSRLWRQWSSDGTRLFWTSERDNWNHLYLFDAVKGKLIRQITKGNWFVRGIQNINEEKGVVYFSASGMTPNEDPYQVHYYRIGIDGKHLVALTPEDGNHSAKYSSDYKYLVDTYSKADQAPVTVLRNAETGELIKTLETADLSKIKSNGWVAPEIFKAPGRDGKTMMWGIIQRPTNFDPSKHYPVIEYIYAGPGDAYTPKSFISYNWTNTSLAELGFIVVQLDAMGTSYRGKKFEEVCYKNLKDAGFPDRELWIKAACKKYPYMDSTRVGIFGASAGGQESTTAVLLHGDFYKAAYSSCGCQDNRMDKIWWNEQWMGWPVDSSYVECSNVYNAPKLERPLMLVVGELDDNVDPSSTYQVVNALIKANKNFELVVLPGVHHTLGENFGEHKRYDFFVKNLLGVDPPKWNEIKY